MSEEWRYLPISGRHSRYQVSSLGNIRKVNIRLGTEVSYRPLKTCMNRGYPSLTLRDNGKPRTYDVHYLVAQAFVRNPHGYKHVRHIDGNRMNNAATNLEWHQRKRLAGCAVRNLTSVVARTIGWLYEQHGKGAFKCADIDELANRYENAMAKEYNYDNRQ